VQTFLTRATAAAFCLLAAWTVLLGAAEALARQDTARAIQQAIAIQSGPWTLHAGPAESHLERLAELDPAGPVPALRAAVQMHPRLSWAWIALGLEAEHAGDLAAAEAALVQAARWDHQYLPAWTLANYYFRRGNREAFWPWARQAASRTYDDFRPLLRLCDALEPDPVLVLDRLNAGSLTSRHRMAGAYLDLLMAAARWSAAEQVAGSLDAAHDAQDRRRVADLARRELQAGRTCQICEAW
jgi:tetratricopeptide (TPR) repeat protein